MGQCGEPDSRVELIELVRSLDDESACGYLEVAIENQGVVTWHVPPGRGDDPPVRQAPEGVVSEAEPLSASFSNFVFDMIANHFSRFETADNVGRLIESVDAGTDVCESTFHPLAFGSARNHTGELR